MQLTQRKTNKLTFVGISMGQSILAESGIAVLDRELNLVRVDKAFGLEDIEFQVDHIGQKDQVIICVDLPYYSQMLNRKWRIESKPYKTFNLNDDYDKKKTWINRYSDRGADLCKKIAEKGFEVYRYNSSFTRNMIRLDSPYKERSPADCKHVQMALVHKLKLKGIPSNLMPLSGIDAIVGAYIGWNMATKDENEGYKFTGDYKDLKIVSAI